MVRGDGWRGSQRYAYCGISKKGVGMVGRGAPGEVAQGPGGRLLARLPVPLQERHQRSRRPVGRLLTNPNVGSNAYSTQN